MSSDDITLVLTTREWEWWWSMQEITRAIEHVWTGISQSSQENVRMLRVPLPQEIEQGLPTFASRLKRIVIIAIGPESLRLALLLRVQRKVAAPMIIYNHGHATTGLHAFGALADALTERDTFVASCEAEAVTIRCCFPNARVSVIPFPLVDQFKLNDGQMDTRPKTARLAYVGRISEQKNLHTLLFALWILRTWYGHAPGITLEVYGSEDNHGSPNMGLNYPNYGTYLQRLAELLGVADMVTWHGAKPRDWLFENVHLKPHIFVSPTLHSDENFGSSVLASLANGHQVVTTAWGGHLGFQAFFPQQLALVPVHRSTMGPVVHPVLLANSILQAITMSTEVVEDASLDQARAEFSEGTATTRTIEMLSQSDPDPVSLMKSPTQQYLDERRAAFGGTRTIYTDYKDPVAQIFFEAYGMNEPLTFEAPSRYVLTPWVSYSNQVLRIDDPHRGQQSFSIDTYISNPLDVMMCPSMNKCRLPESLVRSLAAQGYAFPLHRVLGFRGQVPDGAPEKSARLA